MYCKSR